MKSLAGKFSVTATRPPRDAKPTELRLLLQPLFRFETGDGLPRPDGALFGFAEGTDPVGLLLLDAFSIALTSRAWFATIFSS